MGRHQFDGSHFNAVISVIGFRVGPENQSAAAAGVIDDILKRRLALIPMVGVKAGAFKGIVAGGSNALFQPDNFRVRPAEPTVFLLFS